MKVLFDAQWIRARSVPIGAETKLVAIGWGPKLVPIGVEVFSWGVDIAVSQKLTRCSPPTPPICLVHPEWTRRQWSHVTTMLCGQVDCIMVILNFLLNNNNLCPMDHLWHAFVTFKAIHRDTIDFTAPSPAPSMENSRKIFPNPVLWQNFIA